MEQMLKSCSLFLFNFSLSLSLSLSLTAIDLATTLLTSSRHLDLSLSHSKPLPLSHFGLSTSLATLSLSPFRLLVSGCGSVDCCSDGIQVLCFFFFPPMVMGLFNFYMWLFFGWFWDDFCCKFSWIWVVVMVGSGFGL